MREIKFRAWDGKRMDYDYRDVSLWNGILVAEGDTILMQFTGLTDRSGKDIYEGDILRSEMFPGGTLGPFYNLYTVSWGDYFVTVPGDDYEVTREQKYTGWRYTAISSLPQHNQESEPYYWGLAEMQDNVEIIGNIYEQPELIQKAGEA